MKGNQNGRTRSLEEIEEIAKQIKELAPHVCSIVAIIAQLEISQRNYYDLVERYPSVSEAHDLAKNAISSLAWSQGFKQKGFPNILQMAIKRHDVRETPSQVKEVKDIERVKADEKIRIVKELAENIEEGNGNVLDDFFEFLEWKEEHKSNKE